MTRTLIKHQPINKLKKKLDKVFSIYIRKRDSDQYGVGTCITCGRMKEWKYMDAGHYIKRQHLATRFDERNVNIQCKHCNCFQQGANEKYCIAIDKKWGPGTADKLEQKKHNKSQMTAFEYGLLIKHYREK